MTNQAKKSLDVLIWSEIHDKKENEYPIKEGTHFEFEYKGETIYPPIKNNEESEYYDDDPENSDFDSSLCTELVVYEMPDYYLLWYVYRDTFYKYLKRNVTKFVLINNKTDHE